MKASSGDFVKKDDFYGHFFDYFDSFYSNLIENVDYSKHVIKSNVGKVVFKVFDFKDRNEAHEGKGREIRYRLIRK